MMPKIEKKRKAVTEGNASSPKKLKTKKVRPQNETAAPKQNKVTFNKQDSPRKENYKKKHEGISIKKKPLQKQRSPDKRKPFVNKQNKKPFQKQGETDKPFQKEGNADTMKKPFGFDKANPDGKFQKKTIKKGVPQQKPEDWNAFKKQKKELYVKRKQSNTSYDVIVKAKQIGEKLRVKNLEGGKEVKTKLVVELHDYMKTNYVKFVLAHDMARIVQYLLKFGPEHIRQEISQEIIPATVTMLLSKYGKFCVKRMLKYGNAATRSACLRATYGHAIKLTSHAVSAPVYEYAYLTWASPTDRISLVQEFFGDMYKASKDLEVKHLKDVWKNSPTMKVAALGATKGNLARILNKNLLDSSIVQTVLCQFLEECSPEDKSEIITQLASHVVVISNSKDGARVVMQCIWNGTNKDRKAIMKALKEHALALAKHEHGHTALIALFDSADDTVLLNKLILTDLMAHAQELALDEWGRKVLIWLATPADKIHFHPTFVQYIETGRAASNTKKDPEIRRQELLGYCSSTLLKNIAENPKDWFGKASIAVLTLACIKTASGQGLENALNSLSKQITAVDWKIQENNTEMFGIENSGLHMTLKKLAQNDKVASASGKYTFGEAIVKSLSDETVELWIQYNRGCFVLLNLYENGIESVQNSIKAFIEKKQKLIKKQKSSGSSILLKKLI